MLRCIIVDDEKPARTRMRKLLNEYSHILKIISEAVDGIDAIEKIEDFIPDVVFLDIEMPGLNGIEVAKHLAGKTKIVFVTAYDEFAIQAFEANAVDYLVKPINKERLEKTIKKLQPMENNNSINQFFNSLSKQDQPKRIAFKLGSKYQIFDSASISCIQSKDQYSSCIVDGKEILSDDSLEQLLSRLDSNQFIKIHRSHIINLNFLKELKREGDRKYTAILSDFQQTEVPVSREKLNELKSLLGLKNRT